MSSNHWNEIKYSRVSSKAMYYHKEHFYRHDTAGFEKYLEAVEHGKKSISGATLMPHELVRGAMIYHQASQYQPDPLKPSIKDFRKRLADAQLRIIGAQWKSMVDNLRESGKLDNALAVCDVSGSMGCVSQRNASAPIYPAISLSLVLAQLAKPPFANGFITFSMNPQFIEIDPSLPLNETISAMQQADWGMNTNFNAVFLDLLLPLAIKHQVRPEDMIKRLVVFSDMQFDVSQDTFAYPGPRIPNPIRRGAEWETNHDVVQKAYEEAGYEMPEIVYWNLEQGGTTTPVEYDRKGVALMNGFSPAMLKTFMGETVDDADLLGDGESKAGSEQEKKKEDFTPLAMMKKALSNKSYDGLIVVD